MEEEIQKVLHELKHPDIPEHSDIQENEYLKKLKREDIKDYIVKNYGSFDRDLVEEFRKCIFKPFFIEKAQMNKLPNVCVLKRSNIMNLSAYYVNEYKNFISKQKRWDKDIIIITT